MEKERWGRFPDVKPEQWWGGRAIVSMEYGIDIPRDRQSYEGDVLMEDTASFMKWINEQAMPELNRMVKSTLLYNQSQVVELHSKDNRYKCEACCNNSGGYLYIGCWEVGME